MEYKIYELVCPYSNKPFYIGRTKNNLNNRLSSHMSSKTTNVRLKERILFLKANNKPPIINEIFSSDSLDMGVMEDFWIYQYKLWGYDLFNIRANSKKLTKGVNVLMKEELFKQLEKERKKIKPAPSLHAYMVFKLSK